MENRKDSMKAWKGFWLSAFLMLVLVLQGCGGSGGGGGAAQGSGLLTVTVSPGTINTPAESGNESVTVEFTLSPYKEGLTALHVVIERYLVSFERTDCQGCPVPQSFTVGSGAYLEAGDSYSEEITLITEQMKMSLPIAAVRDDEYNPVANQAVPVDTQNTEVIARGRSEVIARYGTPVEELIATGNGSTTVFNGTLGNPPVVKGTFRVLVTGSTGYLYETAGSGGSYSYTHTLASPPVVPGSVGIVVYNNKRTLVIGTGDGTTTNFNATLNPPVLEGSVVIKVDDTFAGSDDGAGGISGPMISSGTIDYSSGTLSVTFATPPASGSTITAEYLNSTESLVATDDSHGQIIGTNGNTVSGYVDYTTGVLSVNFAVPPFAGSTVGVLYLSAGEGKTEVGKDNGSGSITGTILTGSIDYSSGYFVLSFSTPPFNGQQIYAEYVQGAGSTEPNQVVYTLQGVPIVPGTVVITDGSDVLATDDGNGNLAGSGANGTVSYADGSLVVNLTVDTSGISTLQAVYAAMVQSALSMYPIVPGSVEVSAGDATCHDVPDGSEYTATYGTLSYPCRGTVAYSDGTLTDFGFYLDSTAPEDITATYKVRTSSYLGGDRNLATGNGYTTEFNLTLHYPPIEPPHGEYAAVIATTDGLKAVDTGGGTLDGDVCPAVRSYIDYQTGRAYVCFSRPPADGAEVFALYRSSSIRMNARIKAEGYEVGGKSISVNRTVTITVN